jgi:hypothetical protein
MQLNLQFNSDVPTDFAKGLQTATAKLDALITDPITVTIGVGYGEVNGAPLGPNVAGASEVAAGAELTPAALVTALGNKPNPITTSELQGLNSTNALAQLPGAPLFTSQPELKALGLAPANTVETDGFIGFGSSYNWALGGAVPGVGQLSQEMVAEHEITEAMGRSQGGPMTFLQWASPGKLAPIGQEGAHYLSFDGGATQAAAFSPVGDLSDFTGTGDPFEFVTPFGAQFPFSKVDSEYMAGLGFGIEGLSNPTPTPPPPVPKPTPTPPPAPGGNPPGDPAPPPKKVHKDHHEPCGHKHYQCEWERHGGDNWQICQT